MVFTCQLCVQAVFTTVLLSAYLSHLFTNHARDPNFHVICGVDNCPQTFRTWHALYRHCRRSHLEHFALQAWGEDPRQDHALDHDENVDMPESDEDGDMNNDEDIDPGPPDIEVIEVDGPIDVNKLRTAAFILSIKEENAITQAATDQMVNQNKLLLSTIAEDLDTKIRQVIENDPEIDRGTAERITGRITSLLQPMNSYYSGLENQYHQRLFYQSHFSLVLPEEHVLGHTLRVLGTDQNRHAENVPHVCYYVPFMEMLRVLLERQQYREHIFQDHRRRDGLLSDFCDGLVFQNNPIFSRQLNSLQILLYYDEVELCNPLSSTTHKVGLFYFTLGNIEARLRSRLLSINLLIVAASEDLKRYGIDAVLEPFYRDLSELSQVGLNVAIPDGQELNIKGALVAVCADTPAAHEIAGFKEGVGFSFRKCRHCMATFEQMQEYVFEEDFVLRNMETHTAHCGALRNDPLRNHYSTTYGVNREAAILAVEHFNIFQGIPQDVMHIILEGSMKYTLKIMLQYFINTENMFRLTQLNEWISSFPYSYIDFVSKPSPIKEQHLDGPAVLHQSSSQTWLLGRLLPFYIGNLIDFESQQWQCFSLLLQITCIVLSPVVSRQQVDHLKQIIAFYLGCFKRAFPDKNITPKQHYMVHLPQTILNLGPIVRYWCMRFEARHKYFKRLAKVASFKNLPKYLAERHQYRQCRELLDIEKSGSHPLFKNIFKTGPSTRLDNQIYHANEINRFYPDRNMENYTVIYSMKWVEINGNRYKPKCYVVPRAEQEMPVFSQVQDIWYDGSEYFLRLETHDNNGICEDLNAYEITKPDLAVGLEVIKVNSLIVPFPMCSYRFEQKQYIPIKYDFTSLFSESIKL